MATQQSYLTGEPERFSYLFGYPISHSLSPLLHQTINSTLHLNWSYELYESLELEQFMTQIRADPKFLGSAVTMPHKVAIIPYLDGLTPEAAAVGAVNTIFINGKDEQGRMILYGTNTDVVGIREAFLQNLPSSPCQGRPALIVGGGGTSRAAIYSLKNFLGCSSIYMINRDKAEVDTVIGECKAKGFGDDIIHVSSVGQAEALEAPGAIVSCIPDFLPVLENEILARTLFDIMLSKPTKGAVLEMCYHPSPNTNIATLATERGWKVVPGTEAMIGQALEQSRLWTGRELSDLPVEKVKRVIRAAATHSKL